MHDVFYRVAQLFFAQRPCEPIRARFVFVYLDTRVALHEIGITGTEFAGQKPRCNLRIEQTHRCGIDMMRKHFEVFGARMHHLDDRRIFEQRFEFRPIASRVVDQSPLVRHPSQSGTTRGSGKTYAYE